MKFQAMTIFRRVTIHASLLSMSLIFVACTTGDDFLMRQAKDECTTRGMEVGSKAYDACVHRRSEALYEYQQRRMFTGGE